MTKQVAPKKDTLTSPMPTFPSSLILPALRCTAWLNRARKAEEKGKQIKKERDLTEKKTPLVLSLSLFLSWPFWQCKSASRTKRLGGGLPFLPFSMMSGPLGPLVPASTLAAPMASVGLPTATSAASSIAGASAPGGAIVPPQSTTASGAAASAASAASGGAKRKEIYKYEAPWTVYSMNWSVRPDKRFRLALGSFVEEYNNKVGDGSCAEPTIGMQLSPPRRI